MGLRPELMQEGKSYMEIVGAFAFFQAISLTISASLRSANQAIYPMMVTVVVNILNILGNYSLIFGKFGFPLDENIRGILFVRHWNSKKWAKKGFVR